MTQMHDNKVEALFQLSGRVGESGNTLSTHTAVPANGAVASLLV